MRSPAESSLPILDTLNGRCSRLLSGVPGFRLETWFSLDDQPAARLARSPFGALSHGAEAKVPASPRKVYRTCLVSVVSGRVVSPFQTNLLSRRNHDQDAAARFFVLKTIFHDTHTYKQRHSPHLKFGPPTISVHIPATSSIIVLSGALRVILCYFQLHHVSTGRQNDCWPCGRESRFDSNGTWRS